MATKPKKVALAYSGGLDTSIIIPWLKETYGCEIVAICGDIGQGGDELAGIVEKAKDTGASEVFVEDMRQRTGERPAQGRDRLVSNQRPESRLSHDQGGVALRLRLPRREELLLDDGDPAVGLARGCVAVRRG